MLKGDFLEVKMGGMKMEMKMKIKIKKGTRSKKIVLISHATQGRAAALIFSWR